MWQGGQRLLSPCCVPRRHTVLCPWSPHPRRVCGDELPCDGGVPSTLPTVPLRGGNQPLQGGACAQGVYALGVDSQSLGFRDARSWDAPCPSLWRVPPPAPSRSHHRHQGRSLSRAGLLFFSSTWWSDRQYLQSVGVKRLLSSGCGLPLFGQKGVLLLFFRFELTFRRPTTQ